MTRETLVDRCIRENRDRPHDCWLWPGSLNRQGYGKHRAVYQRLVGPIAPGLHLDHLCRVRNCVNPAHLEPVTPRVNTLRGEGQPAKRAAWTRCMNGHPFTPENTIITRSGNRRCRRCHVQGTTVRMRRYIEKLKGSPIGPHNAFKTHCRNGHPYSPENTHVRKKNGARVCLACLRESSRQVRARKRAEREAAENHK